MGLRRWAFMCSRFSPLQADCCVWCMLSSFLLSSLPHRIILQFYWLRHLQCWYQTFGLMLPWKLIQMLIAIPLLQLTRIADRHSTYQHSTYGGTIWLTCEAVSLFMRYFVFLFFFTNPFSCLNVFLFLSKTPVSGLLWDILGKQRVFIWRSWIFKTSSCCIWPSANNSTAGSLQSRSQLRPEGWACYTVTISLSLSLSPSCSFLNPVFLSPSFLFPPSNSFFFFYILIS